MQSKALIALLAVTMTLLTLSLGFFAGSRIGEDIERNIPSLTSNQSLAIGVTVAMVLLIVIISTARGIRR